MLWIPVWLLRHLQRQNVSTSTSFHNYINSACDPPNANSAPAIYGPRFGNSDTTGEVSRAPIATCTTCTPNGNVENYWASSDFNNGLDAFDNAQLDFASVCNDWTLFCTCDVNGNCCTFSGTQENLAANVQFVGAVAYCASAGSKLSIYIVYFLGCNTYTILSSNVPLTCGGSQSAASFDPTIPFTTAGAYFNGISYNCGGCDAIRNTQCTGPAVAA